jgi:hypothetical protein
MNDWSGIRARSGRRCSHRYTTLAMVLDAQTGSYYVRCLGCMKMGPECTSPEAARKALLVLGARV